MVRASFWVTLRWYDWRNRGKSIFCAWFKASAAMSIRSPFFWDVTKRTLMVSYRRFGTTCQSRTDNPPKKSQYLSINLSFPKISSVFSSNCVFPDLESKLLPLENKKQGNKRLGTWCVFIRTSSMKWGERPTRCYTIVYWIYDSFNMLRAPLCPPSGAVDYTDIHTMSHITLVMAGCRCGVWL